MEIDQKYLDLLNCYIYDKRTDQSGMLTDICITSLMAGKYLLYYHAYYSWTKAQTPVFVDDIEAGTVAFILPFSEGYLKEELEKKARQDENAIKEFFGKNFREDMIIPMPEEKRQEMISKSNTIETGLKNLGSCCPL